MIVTGIEKELTVQEELLNGTMVSDKPKLRQWDWCSEKVTNFVKNKTLQYFGEATEKGYGTAVRNQELIPRFVNSRDVVLIGATQLADMNETNRVWKDGEQAPGELQ